MKHQNTVRIFSFIVIMSLLLSAVGMPAQIALAAPKDTALQFDGTNDYVTFGAASGLGITNFTIETWFKRTGAGTTTSTGSGGVIAVPLVSKGMAEADGSNKDTNYFLGIGCTGTSCTGNALVADFEDTTTATNNHPLVGVTQIPADSVWHHAAATYDASTGSFSIYLDGQLENSITVAIGKRTPRSDSIQHAALGTALNSCGLPGGGSPTCPAQAAGYFAGVLDEARVWNVVRTQADIQSTMNSEVTSGTGLLARWGLNEGSGTTVNSSVGTFQGTLTNGPVWVTADLTPPAAPTGLAASPYSGGVSLTWTANTEPDLAGYNLYRSTTTGGPYTKVNSSLITTLNYSDGGLTNGTPYYYVLRAVDTSSNESGNSSEVSATPLASLGAGLNFDGTNDYVTFGNTANLGVTNFTIETWFYWTGGGDTVSTGSGGLEGTNVAIPLVTKGRGEGDGSTLDMNYFFGLSNGKLAADFEEDETGPNADGLNHPVIGNTTVTNNTWHHAAVTYDGQVWKLFLDGVLDKTLDLGATLWPRDDSIQHAGIATAMTSTGVTDGFFQGRIDEVRIWNVARTQAEINATINQEVTSGSGLVARWGMGEGSGTTINSSVGTFPGTLTNGPTFVAGAPFDLVFDTTPPAAPAGLSATAGNSLVNLAWSANGESDLAGYNLYRSTTSGGVYSKVNGTLVTGTSYTDSGLANGTPYYYVLRAVDTSNNESGNSNEATATPVVGNTALQFTGASGTYVTFGDPAKLDLSTFTIETWFKRIGTGTPNTTGSGGIANAIPLVTHGSPQSDGSNVDADWILVINNDTGAIAADFEDSATGLNHPVSGVTPIVNDTWYHAAATYDGTTWRLYLNGNLERTLVVGAYTPRADSIQRAGLGSMIESDGTTNGFFQGVIDEARVWNVARTHQQIQDDINNQLTSGTGLVARWGLNDGTGTTVADSIAPAAAGTVTGANYSWVAGAPFNIVVDPPVQYTLTVSTIGSGSIGLSPAGGTYPAGTVVTLTPIPASGWLFDSWSGDLTGSTRPATITMNGNKSVTASFIQGYEATVSFQDGAGGYAGTVDSLLYQAIPDTSYGTLDYVKWDTSGTVGTGTGEIFGLLRFDDIFGSGTGRIPPGSAIQSAQLQYVVYDTGDPADVNEVLVDWDESSTYAGFGGESGVQPDEYGTSVGLADGSSSVTYTLDVTTSLRTWSDNPAGNRGWIFRPTNTGGVQFRSSESITATEHPRLVVTYLTNVPPNQAPSQPVLVVPANGATDISTSPTLTVHVSDPEADPLTVSFYGRAAGGPAPVPFTFVTIPDTQNYSLSDSAATTYFNAQTQWIVNQRTDRNIVFASHMGDITENGDVAAEWTRADAAMDILDNAGLPNGVVPGNHDMGTSDFAAYAAAFPPSRYQGFSWYGGYLGDPNDGIDDFGVDRGNRDSYQLFSTAGMDFIVIHLELDPPQYAIDWANAVLDAYPQRRAIVTTHAFVNTSGLRPTSPYTRTTDGKSAEYVWQNLIYPNCQVFLVLNGNYPGEGRRSDPNSCGQSVHQVLQDYQGYPNGGNGWLRYYVFDPAQDQIQAYTYSPVLGQYETDASSQFTLAYDMAAGTPFTLIGTQSVASGSDASITWNGLSAGTQYEWYAVASDGAKSTTGATWNFTTTGGGSNQPPAITEGASVDVTLSEDGAPNPFSLTLNATDPDAGDTLTWSISSAAAHGTATATGTGLSRVISYSPNANYNGSDSFVVQVSDGQGGTDTITVNVTIVAVNDAPLVTNPGTQSNAEGEEVSLQVQASDVDVPAQTLAYSASNLPTGLSINSASGLISGSVSAGASANSPYNVTVTVTDGTTPSQQSFTWNVSEAPAPLCGSDPALVGCWPMEEDGGTILVDQSSYGNNATITGSPAWVPGKIGQALDLSGNGQYAMVPDSSSLDISSSRITLAAWVKPEKLATQNIIKKTTGTAIPNGYELSLSASGKVFMRLNGNSAYRIDSLASYPTDGNTWIHAAATYDGTNLRIYINGALDNTKAATVTIAPNTTNLGIGAEPTFINLYQGLLDDVRVYDRVLSLAEIQVLAGITPPVLHTLTVSKTGTGAGTVTSSPTGIVCGTTCSYDFPENTSVTLTAASDAGSTFTGWSGAGCSGTGTCTVPMDAVKSVTANFTLNAYTLTVSMTGAGTITSDPAGISCGATCSYDYDFNTDVTLTATPDPNWTFTGWSGACTGTGSCQVTMDGAKTVSASFSYNSFTLTIGKTGSGSGTVTSNPAGIDCGLTCSYNFAENTPVTITAAAAPGSTFTGWTGECTGTGTCNVIMSQTRFVGAEFTAIPVPSGLTCTDLGTKPLTAGTGEKPQSKLWQYDGAWWAVFPTSTGASSAGTWLWKLDGLTWMEVLKLSNRTDTKADAKVLNDVVHILLYAGTNTELVSVQYNGTTYQLWAGRQAPSPVSLSGSEIATIDIDTTGHMWLATENDANDQIVVYHSDSPYSTWNGPITLATGVNDDDIAVVVALPNKIGVLWSNQITRRFGFRVHNDGDDPNTWSADEVPASQSALNIGSGMADDHLNVKVASNGTLYAAVKTSYDTAGYPKVALLVRRPSGIWDNLYSLGDTGTRGNIELDEVNGVLTYLYTQVEGYSNIVYRQSYLNPIFFGAQQTLRSGSFNDVSSTKDNYNTEIAVIYGSSTQVAGQICTAAPVSGADLAITKTDGITGVRPGDTLIYTVQVTNNGPEAVTGATVTDTLSAMLTNVTWTCAGAGGGSCTAAGSGNINDSVDLPVQASVTYTLSATVDLGARGSLANTAAVAVPAGVTDPIMGNNSATDTDTIVADGTTCGSDPTLVGCWQMEEGSGSVLVDGSSSANDASLVGSPAWMTGKAGNYALDLNGTSQYGVVPDDSSLDLTDQITIAAWIKPEVFSNNPQDLVKKAINGTGPAGTNGYELSLSSTGSTWPQKVFFRINQAASGDTYRVNSTTLYPSDGNTWIHVAGTFDGSNLRLYINGQLEATTPATGQTIATNTLPLTIGAQDGTTASRFYQGWIDDVRVYNRALSASEIQTLFGNHPPVAMDDAYTTDKNTVLNMAAPGVLDNDSDPDSDPLTAVKVSDPANGALTLDTDGSFTYTPTSGFSGEDTFTYKANDGGMDSNVATVTITVNAGNQAPVCTPMSVTTPEDTGGDTTLTCTDPDNNPLTYSIVTQPSHGTATLNGAILNYMPDANYFGPDTLEFTASDGTLESAAAAMDIAVTAVNDAPVCQDVTLNTNEDASVQVAPSCTDVDNDPLTYSIANQPFYGIASVVGGDLVYAPEADYYGADSFTYLANDGTADSGLATVGVTVTPLNDPPVASSQSVTTGEDVSKNLILAGSDVEGSPLTFTIITTPAHGSLQGEGAEQTYTPDADFNGPDSFTFIVNDGELDSASAIVSITVNPVNDAPLCADVNLLTTRNVIGQADPSCTDVDGNPLSYSIVGQPVHGTASVVDGRLQYAPDANYSGTDTFTYNANDEQSDSNISAVHVVISHTNTPPTADDQTVTTAEDTPLAITLTAIDPDGDSLSYSIVNSPAHGSFDGGIYTPSLNYNGPDVFTFKANDGTVDSNLATVSITVNPVNDAPVAEAKSVTLDEDTSKAITLTGSDLDGDTLTFAVASLPAHGTLSGNAPDLTYTPAADFSGDDSFTFTASDGQAASEAATVSIHVNAVNDAPVCSSLSLETNEDTPASKAPSCTDIDSTSLTYSIVISAAHGTASISGSLLEYSPGLNYYGPDSFTYKANDGTSDSSQAAVTVSVLPLNDPPVLVQPANQTNAEGDAASLQLSASDADGDLLTYTASGLPQGLSIDPATGLISGSLSYSTAGSYNVTVTADDSKGGTDSKSFTWTVTDVKYTLTVSVVGSGTVGRSPNLTSYEPGTPVQLTATPDSGWVFSGWSGDAAGTANPVTVTMNANRTVTATFVPDNTQIFKDSFGSCSASAWSSTVNPGSLTFTGPAAWDAPCGMAVNISSNNPAYVRDDTPAAETRYQGSFQLNLNNIAMGKNNAYLIFSAYNTSNAAVIVLELRRSGNNYQLRAGTLTDRNKWSYTSWVTLANGWQSIAFDWRAATAAGANNGSLSLTVNNLPTVSVNAIDNDTRRVEWIGLGAVSGVDNATRGSTYFDAFESRR